MKRTYDPQCRELASHFLTDYSGLSVAQREFLIHELANEIQCSIEDWFNNHTMELTGSTKP